MLSVLRTTWPLLLGVMLLMVGNGMQGTLLGIRGSIENISTLSMSLVMASYFGGFLAGSLVVPGMIQRVGHVRVFAALGSLISAILVLYPSAPYWQIWALLRLAIGFSFCGVYITAESWLNASSTNENRGQALSAYMIVQMSGIVIGQLLLNVSDPAGFISFVIPSVLVSLAFTPILLSRRPAPQFTTLQRMSLRRLWEVSPLGCVGIFLMGGVFSALFGMSSVWGAAAGLTVREISAFVSAMYLGGMLFQYPIGWFSDRGDRRVLIIALSALGFVVIAALIVLQPGIWGLLLAAAVVGGVANPVYSLLVAHTNDQIPAEDMAAASAGLLFINGIGSFSGPLTVGWLMGVIGLNGFWIYIEVLMGAMCVYAVWRMRRRSGPGLAPGGYAPLSPSATSVAVEAALEVAQSSEDDQPEAASGTDEEKAA